MNISRLNFKSSFLSGYKITKKNTSDIAKVGESLLNKDNSMSDRLMIDKMKVQLSSARKSENETQAGMSFLTEEKRAVDSLKTLSNKLKDLSSKYNDKTTELDEKQDIKKQADEIIKNMNSVINDIFGDKSIFKGKTINVETGYKTGITISLKNFNISLDPNKKNIKDDVFGFHIEGKLDIDDILKSTYKIENDLIKPLDKLGDDIKDQMVGLVNNAIYQDMLVKSSVKKLLELKELDKYQAGKIISASHDIVDSVYYSLYGDHYDDSGNEYKYSGKIISISV